MLVNMIIACATQAVNAIEPTKSTIGLSFDLTPQYTGKTGGQFIAKIDPPIAGSIPISNRNQLAALGRTQQEANAGSRDLKEYHLDGTYHLVDDVDLSDAEWTPIGDYVNRFKGTFDGQGYVIYELNISRQYFAGLFGYVENATITNVGLEETQIDIPLSYCTGGRLSKN